MNGTQPVVYHSLRPASIDFRTFVRAVYRYPLGHHIAASTPSHKLSSFSYRLLFDKPENIFMHVLSLASYNHHYNHPRKISLLRRK